MVFLFSRIHSDIINTQLRDFSFPLECTFRGRRERGRTSLSASKSLTHGSAEEGSGPRGMRCAGPVLWHPPLGPRLPLWWGCKCPALPPLICQQLCLSLLSRLYTTTKAQNRTNRGTRTCTGRPVPSLSQQNTHVWFSEELLLAGAPAWGEHSNTMAGLKVGWKRGRGKGFKLKRCGERDCTVLVMLLLATRLISGQTETGIGKSINFRFFCILWRENMILPFRNLSCLYMPS